MFLLLNFLRPNFSGLSVELVGDRVFGVMPLTCYRGFFGTYN